MFKKEQTSGAPSKPTNGKKRPLRITDGPSREQKPKVPTSTAPNNKPRCKHCDKLGHTAEECWRKAGACLRCGSRENRIPECPLLKKNEKLLMGQKKPGRLHALQEVETTEEGESDGDYHTHEEGTEDDAKGVTSFDNHCLVVI
ncbi:hypothetical protein Taro_047809 [Colocasia esculenta]|uniref:CCHC-type domain-containing protein n=1 Tax=Colocasia esculenta TaxID=4460 RepID=A0A843WTY8_COLES|nr:hypothetical protein [Colocasia esculenta]